MTVIFVGGVHGVGKSTCCAQAGEQLKCLHVSASEIIRKQKSDAVSTNDKLVSDVGGNQDLLLRGFESVKIFAGSISILLDGHFALRDKDCEIQYLSLEVFAGLGVNHLVCFVDAVEAVVLRMGLRDGNAPDADQVATLQDAELSNAKVVAAALGVPLTVLQGFDVEGLKRVLLTYAPANQ